MSNRLSFHALQRIAWGFTGALIVLLSTAPGCRGPESLYCADYACPVGSLRIYLEPELSVPDDYQLVLVADGVTISTEVTFACAGESDGGVPADNSCADPPWYGYANANGESQLQPYPGYLNFDFVWAVSHLEITISRQGLVVASGSLDPDWVPIDPDCNDCMEAEVVLATQ